jgi:hypothetical protein
MLKLLLNIGQTLSVIALGKAGIYLRKAQPIPGIAQVFIEVRLGGQELAGSYDSSLRSE